jgi:DNA-binding XRE family transcriptional regulator
MHGEEGNRMALRPVYTEFGQRVRARRGKSHLTQDMLAHQIGLSRTSVTNIESGRQAVLLHQVYDIARALDTTIQALLPDDKLTPKIVSSSVDDSIPEGVRKFLIEELTTDGKGRQ